jgi:hypothetical protein
VLKSTPRLSLEALGWKKFTLCGSDPEGESEGGTEGQPGNPSGSAADGTGSDANKDGDPQKKISALEEEKNRHFTARQEAERRADELQKFKDKVEAEKLTDTEKAEKANRERDQRIQTLTETNSRLAQQIAFLQTTDVNWVDPGAALALTDLSEVEIDETGKVKNPDVLVAAIKKTASDRPYLVVKAAKDEEEQTPPPASGQPPAGKKAKTNGLDHESLAQKFPALRSHI